MPDGEPWSAMVAEFEEYGFVRLPGLFAPADLGPVERHLARWVDLLAARVAGSPEAGAALHATEPFPRRLAAICADAPEALGGLLRGMNEVWLPTPADPARELYDLVTDPRLLAPLHALLGPELALHRGICRPKLPEVADAAFPVHQDSQYFDLQHPDAGGGTVVKRGYTPSTADLRIVSLWLPLVDTDPGNGCMQFVSAAALSSASSLAAEAG